MPDKLKIKRLIFDADDTLWENNIHYIQAFENLVDLIVTPGLSKSKIAQEFQDLEKKVVHEKGYGSENYLYILHTLFKKYRPISDNDQILTKFEKIYGRDPKQCTIDEFVGTWISLLFIPKKALYIAIAFIIWRILDIVKPYPANQIEKIEGGIGVMFDDIISGLYALIVIHLVVNIIGRMY